MTRPERDELLALLRELSEAFPDVRFGQLVANLVTLSGGLEPEALWEAEDEVLVAAARKQLDFLAAHPTRGN